MEQGCCLIAPKDALPRRPRGFRSACSGWTRRQKGCQRDEAIVVVAENSVTHVIVVTIVAQTMNTGRMELGDTLFVIPILCSCSPNAYPIAMRMFKIDTRAPMSHRVFARSSDEPHLSASPNVQCSGMKDASGIWIAIKAHVPKGAAIVAIQNMIAKMVLITIAPSWCAVFVDYIISPRFASVWIHSGLRAHCRVDLICRTCGRRVSIALLVLGKCRILSFQTIGFRGSCRLA